MGRGPACALTQAVMSEGKAALGARASPGVGHSRVRARLRAWDGRLLRARVPGLRQRLASERGVVDLAGRGEEPGRHAQARSCQAPDFDQIRQMPRSNFVEIWRRPNLVGICQNLTKIDKCPNLAAFGPGVGRNLVNVCSKMSDVLPNLEDVGQIRAKFGSTWSHEPCVRSWYWLYFRK